MKAPRVLLAVIAVSLLGLTAANWPQFRGPGGRGVSDETGLPAEWSDDKGVVWKTPLPGRGSSSPITWGDRIFLTTYKSTGGSMERQLICLNRKDGKILWTKAAKAADGDDDARNRSRVDSHGYASSTPATDGERVYVFFGKSGAAAYDFDGNRLWEKNLGTDSAIRNWGSGVSPVLYKDMVIVNANAESQAIYALDKKTGKQVWKASAEGYTGSWSTPVLMTLKDKSMELVIGVPDEVWGINPDNGKLKWYCVTNQSQPLCTSLIPGDGVVYSLGGGRGGRSAVAIRIGGKGDVTEKNLLWQTRNAPYVPTPVLHGNHLFWVDNGVANCLDAKTGKSVYKERLPGTSGRSETYASVIAADDKIYAMTRFDGAFVLAATPEFKQLSHNVFESDESTFNATPIVSNHQLLLRSGEFLYCIGN